jgi:hypothetical protein
VLKASLVRSVTEGENSMKRKFRFKEIIVPIIAVSIILWGFTSAYAADAPKSVKLPQEKQQKWEGVQKQLKSEYETCLEDCGGSKECKAKCEKAYKSRLDREYQRILYEK